MVRRPPHVLITTPESLYLVLTAARGRETLRHVETVIVDEIHALARDKRGSHLALSLERLKAQVRRRPQLIGLSATQKPVETFASFLTGRPEGCSVVRGGPPSQVGAVTRDTRGRPRSCRHATRCGVRSTTVWCS